MHGCAHVRARQREKKAALLVVAVAELGPSILACGRCPKQIELESSSTLSVPNRLTGKDAPTKASTGRPVFFDVFLFKYTVV